jgi:hypothetical protein
MMILPYMSGMGGKKREAVRHRRGSIETERKGCILQDSDNCFGFVWGMGFGRIR